MKIDHQSFRQLSLPLTEEMLTDPPPRVTRVQFDGVLKDDDYRRLGQFLSHHKHLALRVFTAFRDSVSDLEFLRFFSSVPAFAVDVPLLKKFKGLRHLYETLGGLGLGETSRYKIDLEILDRFPNLKSLSLGGQNKNLQTVCQLQKLEKLAVSGIPFDDLPPLKSLEALESLSLSNGNAPKLSTIAGIRSLRKLWISQVRGLRDLEAVLTLKNLESLRLRAMAPIETLPDFSGLKHLRTICLEGMNGITDLAAVAAAPALETLHILNAPKIDPAAFRLLVGHPNLRQVFIGLGTVRKNNAVAGILKLPGRYGTFEIAGFDPPSIDDW